MVRGLSSIFAIALCAMLPSALFAQHSVSDDANPIYLDDDGAEASYREFTSGGSVADPLQDALYQIEVQAEEIDALNTVVQQKVDPGHSNMTMQVVGRVHADIWGFPGSNAEIDALEGGASGDGPQDRIGFRRLRFGVRGNLPANMEYRLEMEFAGLLRTEFRDAWLGWNCLPVLQTLRLGNQKRPIGLDHWNSSNFNVFMERPFIIETGNQDARRLGIQSWNSSADQLWSWQYGVFNQRILQDESYYISDHWQLQGVGRLANTFWYDEASCGRSYGHWAISGSWGDLGGPPIDFIAVGPHVSEARWQTRPEAESTNPWLDTGVVKGANDFQELGVEGLLNFGPLQFVGEYQSFFIHRDAGQTDLTFQGGYVYASYFLTGEHMVWDRRTNQLGRVVPFQNFFRVRSCDGRVGCGLGAWQIAVRGSYADYSDDDIHGGIGKAITVGLNWYWTPYARMQFNYIHGKIDDSWSRGREVNRDEPLVTGSYDIIGARFMVDF
jgi:phosphate-selective porin OprO/OprP